MSSSTADAHASSWLCPEPGDRERLLEMNERLHRSRGIAMLFLGLALIVCGPWVGWWTLAVLAGLVAIWAVLDRRIPRAAKPEYLMAVGWVMSTLGIFLGTMLTGAADSPAKSWLLIPALSLPARFHKRGLYAGVGFCLVLLLIETVVVDPAHIEAAPQEVIFPAALIAAALALTMALRSAELQHRSDAVIDQLTGMLNRKALEARTVELEVQSRMTGQPVGLIVCDIDHFKAVNDGHGHATGDAVLKGFAYRIRKELRAYDLAYRLGGEEFVVLLPGASLDATEELAARLRDAAESEAVDGVTVTASFGVAASGSAGMDFDALFAAADEALYRAKAGGRNSVRAADGAELMAV
jgi:diguanylate cyclase (GGDEF)-like protein